MSAPQNFNIEVNGQKIQGRSGQTIAAALINAGVKVFRHTPAQAPRGIFCGMGVCFECVVTVNGIPDQRACMTLVQPGMKIETQPNANTKD